MVPVETSFIVCHQPILFPLYLYKVDEITVVTFLRDRGIKLIVTYLDDLLILYDCWNTLLNQLGICFRCWVSSSTARKPSQEIVLDSRPSNFDHCNASVTNQGESGSDPTRGQKAAFSFAFKSNYVFMNAQINYPSESGFHVFWDVVGDKSMGCCEIEACWSSSVLGSYYSIL